MLKTLDGSLRPNCGRDFNLQTFVVKGDAMDDPKLLSEPTNYAVVQLPGRAFPGVVFQGDSLHSLIVELREVAAETDAEERGFAICDIIERLSGVQNNYERVLSRKGIPLPYKSERNKPEPVAQIVVSNVHYHHQYDERAFFEWLERMPFVQDYYGVVRDLYIELNRQPSDADLWEIIGFCRRYGIDLKLLEKFLTGDRLNWLDP